MSDDDSDDRMDRARRIRKMREGQRDGDQGAPEEQHDDSTDDSQETETVTDDDQTTGDHQTESGTDDQTHGTTSGGNEQTHAGGGGQTGSSDEDTQQPTASESEWFEDGGNDARSEDDDAPTAAADAAAAAAEFEADDTDTATGADTGDGGDSGSAAASAAAAAAEFETEETTEVGPEATEGAGPVTEQETETSSQEEVRVLEFVLGGERYCLDIMYVEEIVKEEQITRVPNTPAFVRGVVDLRGQITTILDPKESIGIEGETTDELIVVFDGDTFEDQGHIGWAVDEVRQVTPVTDDEVKESPVDQAHVNGVIEREDEFVIWTRPEIALAEAEAAAEAEANS